MQGQSRTATVGRGGGDGYRSSVAKFFSVWRYDVEKNDRFPTKKMS